MKALCAFHNFLFMNLIEHGTYRSVDTKRIIPSKSRALMWAILSGNYFRFIHINSVYCALHYWY